MFGVIWYIIKIILDITRLEVYGLFYEGSQN